ncbi:MCE family protein [Nocardioides sp. zg-536]|uniref:MCE family protein n=1 Tax=Nocardioides faecalis TaxID=2803858 RepID=A0A938Y8R1_9ACTN|nr:MlaD family protein [Nocardioides faecalis]MBM9459304.1 MCE family protein [Nocardioides faecalis]MBS4751543.1 MCE family protein [Nocardioides faecalis]QVI59572.1 MCE family protein [Nocardioides faecalis]
MSTPSRATRASAGDAGAGARRWQRRARTAQALILIILVGGVVYVTDAVVGGSLFRDPDVLRVELPQAAGLHAGSVVTYRGQRIGEVREVRLGDAEEAATGVGAVATIEIESDIDVPADSAVEVRNLSAVGEQYLEVLPRTAAGPYLAEGDTVPLAQTSVPRAVPDVLAHAQHLMTGLDLEDVRTITAETSAVFGDSADDVDLRALAIELESAFAMLRRLEPDLTALARTAETPLRTFADLGPEVRRLAADLEAVASSLAAATPDVRRTVTTSMDLLPRLDRWWRRSSPQLRRLLRDGVPVTEMAAGHLRGLQHWLDWVPVQADVMAGSTRGGSGRVLLVPRVLKNCVYDRTVQRDVQEVRKRAPQTHVRCTDPPPQTQGRGSARVPRQ